MVELDDEAIIAAKNQAIEAMVKFTGEANHTGLSLRLGYSKPYISRYLTDSRLGRSSRRSLPIEVVATFALNDGQTDLWKYFLLVHPNNRSVLLELLKANVPTEETEVQPAPQGATTTATYKPPVRPPTQRGLMIRAIRSHFDVPDIDLIPNNDIDEWRVTRVNAIKSVMRFHGCSSERQLIERWGDETINLGAVLAARFGAKKFPRGIPPQYLVEGAIQDEDTPLWVYFSLIQPEERGKFITILQRALKRPN